MSTMKALACGKGVGTIERPLYTPGLLLEDEDLTSGVNYTRRLTQLLFSSLFGCGVICGLKVHAEAICGGHKLSVKIDKGLGLDCFGNPIEVSSPVELTYAPDCIDFPDSIWVVACYTERECAPRELSSCDGGGDRANTRHKACYEIKLYGSQPNHACSCEKPEPSQTGNGQDCCCPPGSHATATPVAARAALPAADAGNDCYADHVNGVCSCGCGSNCIVIGRINLTMLPDSKTTIQHIDEAGIDAPVRRIRPMLVGMGKMAP